jgi:dTDP-4-dehydrorhamnose reductase
MINKLIIFGSNGMLGNYIKSYFIKKSYEVICITRKEFEITTDNISKLEEFLVSMNLSENTCIINCNGLIPQRIDKTPTESYYLINTIFPLYLSNICTKYSSKLICPTTDCVFNGKKGDYIETDFHDEINTYGISKSLGESSVATIIRTSIIGEEIHNKKSFLEFVKNSDNINGWNNHYWNGITCYQYCKVMDKIISENLFWKGVRHIYSPIKKTKYELACIIKSVYGLSVNINKCNSDIMINKTLSSIYNTNTIFTIPSLEEQLYEQSKFIISIGLKHV